MNNRTLPSPVREGEGITKAVRNPITFGAVEEKVEALKSGQRSDVRGWPSLNGEGRGEALGCAMKNNQTKCPIELPSVQVSDTTDVDSSTTVRQLPAFAKALVGK